MLARVDPSPVPMLALIGLGFVVGITGHVLRKGVVIATGIGLIFLGSLLLPLALYLSGR
jgi:hypothetical protein